MSTSNCARPVKGLTLEVTTAYHWQYPQAATGHCSRRFHVSWAPNFRTAPSKTARNLQCRKLGPQGSVFFACQWQIERKHGYFTTAPFEMSISDSSPGVGIISVDAHSYRSSNSMQLGRGDNGRYISVILTTSGRMKEVTDLDDIDVHNQCGYEHKLVGEAFGIVTLCSMRRGLLRLLLCRHLLPDSSDRSRDVT